MPACAGMTVWMAWLWFEIAIAVGDSRQRRAGMTTVYMSSSADLSITVIPERFCRESFWPMHKTSVIPAKAGIQCFSGWCGIVKLDACLRRHDGGCNRRDARYRLILVPEVNPSLGQVVR